MVRCPCDMQKYMDNITEDRKIKLKGVEIVSKDGTKTLYQRLP